jgi:hypothetical protein
MGLSAEDTAGSGDVNAQFVDSPTSSRGSVWRNTIRREDPDDIHR